MLSIVESILVVFWGQGFQTKMRSGHHARRAHASRSKDA